MSVQEVDKNLDQLTDSQVTIVGKLFFNTYQDGHALPKPYHSPFVINDGQSDNFGQFAGGRVLNIWYPEMVDTSRYGYNDPLELSSGLRRFMRISGVVRYDSNLIIRPNYFDTGAYFFELAGIDSVFQTDSINPLLYADKIFNIQEVLSQKESLTNIQINVLARLYVKGPHYYYYLGWPIHSPFAMVDSLPTESDTLGMDYTFLPVYYEGFEGQLSRYLDPWLFTSKVNDYMLVTAYVRYNGLIETPWGNGTYSLQITGVKYSADSLPAQSINPSRIKNTSDKIRLRITGQNLEFFAANQNDIEITIRDLHGRKIAKIFKKNILKGWNLINTGSVTITPGIFIISFKMASSTSNQLLYSSKTLDM